MKKRLLTMLLALAIVFTMSFAGAPAFAASAEGIAISSPEDLRREGIQAKKLQDNGNRRRFGKRMQVHNFRQKQRQSAITRERSLCQAKQA